MNGFSPSPIDLAAWNVQVKQTALNTAQMELDQAKQALIDLVGVKDDGSQSTKTGYFKITTIGGFNRTLSKDWETIIGQEGHDVMDLIIRRKPEVSPTGLKQLAIQDPDAYRRVAKAIITKPAKVAVRIENLAEEVA